MSDTTLTDLGPFFRRYDRTYGRLMGASLCASLVLSATIATRVVSTGAPGLKGLGAVWGIGVVFVPLFIAGWWTFGGLLALRRRKTAPLDGSHPAGPVDARNGMRIANAGFAFNLVLLATLILTQLMLAGLVFGFGHQFRGDLIGRAIMLAMGLATIYLGNLWPKMPTSRAEQKAAATMKANRYSGWFMVAVGVLVTLWGLFMPYITPFKPPAPPPFEPAKHREIALSAAELDRFVGHYDFGNDFVVSVTRDGPTLRVLREHLDGARAAPIYPEAPRAFFWKAVEAQIRFTIDAGGKVTGAEFRQGETWQPGKRMTP